MIIERISRMSALRKALPALANFWHNWKVPIVMFGLVGGGHYTWRWVQDQTEFVPKGELMAAR